MKTNDRDFFIVTTKRKEKTCPSVLCKALLFLKLYQGFRFESLSCLTSVQLLFIIKKVSKNGAPSGLIETNVINNGSTYCQNKLPE